MQTRYWTPSDPPDALMTWVDENVIEAIRNSWEDSPPNGWIEAENDTVVMVVAGPEKPETPGEPTDVYSIQIDLLEELTEYATPYDDIGGPRGENHAEDLRERAGVLRKLAADVLRLADRAEQAAARA